MATSQNRHESYIDFFGPWLNIQTTDWYFVLLKFKATTQKLLKLDTRTSPADSVLF